MNQIIETLLSHRSIRHFEDRPLTKEHIEIIVASAQAASTSSYVQAYSIIGVTDHGKKKKLAELSGNQKYVENNGHFFVFCADLFRHEIAGELENKDISTSIESTEKFMVALIDAALAAQNAAIAAESLGLGICYIGGLRNNLNEVCDQRPRLPLTNVYHENEYQQNTDKFKQELRQYNEIVSSYYEKRTKGKRKDTWTEQMANTLSNPTRMYMNEFIKKHGLDLK